MGRGSRVTFSQPLEPFKGWKNEGSELGVMGCIGGARPYGHRSRIWGPGRGGVERGRYLGVGFPPWL